MVRRGSEAVVAVVLSTALAWPAAPALAQSAIDGAEADAPFAAAAAKKHRKRQKHPIKMGTSGGNIEDFSIVPPNIICCSGTLGALLTKKDRYFILSNNHVLARVNQGVPGDDIAQPGLIDTRCEAKAKNLVGTLSDFKTLKTVGTNAVDAAIAETTPDDVRDDGALIGLGVPGNKVMAPKVGTAVVKSGRTTGVTRGEVTAKNVRGFVTFPVECGSDEEVEAQFKKVFLVEATDNGPFSAGGDSGSVIYEDVVSCPRAMGLLFAGNDEFTAANPMKQVMKAVKKMTPKGKATLVGCEPAAAFGDWETSGADPAERRAMRVQERIEERVLATPGVHAIGVGRAVDGSGRTVLRVLVDRGRPDAAAALPSSFDGVPVEVVETGRLRALSCPAETLHEPLLGGLRAHRSR